MNVRWEASNLTTLGGSTVMGILIGIAMIGAVIAGVTFFMGERAPDGVWIAAYAGLGAAVLFGVLAWLSYQRSRARVRVGWSGEALVMEIEGPQGSARYTGPFKVARGWMRDVIATGHGTVPMKVVMCAVLAPDGRALLYLREQLGAIHSVPYGWPERIVRVASCEHLYTNSLGRLELDRLVEALGADDY